MKKYNKPQTEIVCIAPANMIMSVSGTGGGNVNMGGDSGPIDPQ